MSKLFRPSRPSWDEIWLSMACIAGRRSRCSRAQIGCVLVSEDNDVVAVSYVGPPPDFIPANLTSEDCISWCERPHNALLGALDPGYGDCVSSHAEMNAVARADYSLLRGGTAYVNSAVCFNCAKLLVAAGIGKVVMIVAETEAHRQPERTLRFLAQNGVDTIVLNRVDVREEV